MKKLFTGFLLSFFLTGLLAADGAKVITLADADLRLAYSSVSNSGGAWSGDAWIFLMPAVKFNQSDYLLPILSSSFSTSEKVIEEETLFANRWNNLFSLGYKHKYSETMDLKASGDVRYNFNMQTKDELLGKGLYDLFDIGGTVSLSLYPSAEEKQYPLTFTAKYYSRTYPNYTSLAASGSSGTTITISANLRPKNYAGTSLTAEWKGRILGLAADASYNLVLKGYYDDLILDTNGVITGPGRIDAVHFVDLGLMDFLSSSFTIGVDCNFTDYASSGNEFDSNALVYQGNYYSYTSVSARPNVHFLLGNFTVNAYYQYLVRNYASRNARAASGVYLPSTETDYEHTIGVNLKLPLSNSVSWVSGMSFFTTSSNMAYEQYVKYSYQIFNISSGIAINL